MVDSVNGSIFTKEFQLSIIEYHLKWLLYKALGRSLTLLHSQLFVVTIHLLRYNLFDLCLVAIRIYILNKKETSYTYILTKDFTLKQLFNHCNVFP